MPKTKPVLIVVANSAQAEIYIQQRRYAKPELLAESSAEALTAPKTDSDRPGRTFDSVGAGRHAKTPNADPQRLGEELFARKLSTMIEMLLRQESGSGMVIFAPPRFLGALRAALPAHLERMVYNAVAKDLVGAGPELLHDNLVAMDGVPRLESER